MRTDRTGRDPSKWEITGWLYNNIFYRGIDELKTAATQSGFEKLGMVVDGSWAQLVKVGDALPFDELPPPVSVQPGAKRFSVDTKENFVSWSRSQSPSGKHHTQSQANHLLVDFSFYVSVSRDMGVRLFDIKYKGKRIIYEVLGIPPPPPLRPLELKAYIFQLGMEEALAHYS